MLTCSCYDLLCFAMVVMCCNVLLCFCYVFAVFLQCVCYVLLCFAMFLLCFSMCRYEFATFCYVFAVELANKPVRTTFEISPAICLRMALCTLKRLQNGNEQIEQNISKYKQTYVF